MPCVKSDVRILEHERILRESRIERRVLDDERFDTRDRVTAEGQLPRAVGDRKTLPRLEPLPVTLDEGYSGKRHLEHALRHAADFVEALLWCFVNWRAKAQLDQALRLVRRDERT